MHYQYHRILDNLVMSLSMSILGRVVPLIALFIVCSQLTSAQSIDRTSDKIRLADSSPAQTFSFADIIGESMPLLSPNHRQNASLPSSFYPLLPDNISGVYFEQVQSLIIPGGIVDTANKVVYLENGSNNIVKLDLASGVTIKRVNDVCMPIAVIDNCLYALAKSKREAKFFYSLVSCNANLSGYKTIWSPIMLPDWLDLPADGENQKFVFSNHCFDGILSTAWQASKQAAFPNAFAWLAPYMSRPMAFQGHFACQLNAPIIVSQSIQESTDDFSAYLSAKENTLPNQISLSADNVAINTYDNYLFSLVRVFPPEHNISKAGVVGKRELQVTDLNTGKIIWTHTLPATFVPLSFQ